MRAAFDIDGTVAFGETGSRTPVQEHVFRRVGVQAMDLFFKSVLTTAGALLVLAAAQRFGPRVAGLIAALPLVTAPALVWLAHDQGTAFAVGAAVSSVAACAMLAIFALIFSIASRYANVGVALAAGCLGAAVMTYPTLAASVSLVRAIALAMIFCGVVRFALPAPRSSVARRPASPRGSIGVALTVGTFTALLATIAPALGVTVTGLLSSLPLIGATAAILEHAHGGHQASTQFLSGYVTGLFGKAAFGVVFSLLAPPLGSVFAVLLACGAASLLLMMDVRQWSAVSGFVLAPSARRLD